MKKSINALKKITLLASFLILGVALSWAVMTGVSSPTVAAQAANEFQNSDPKSQCPTGKYVNPDGSPCASDRKITLDASKDPKSANCTDGCGIVTELINPFINLMTAIVGLVVAISLVVGGITYSSAGGDPSKVAAAKKRITNSVIALIAYLFTFGLLQWLVPGGII